jgi:GTP 3',8-cyclase
MLTDSYNRVHNYLRIALTDKCNLRCTYCCPVDLPKGFFAGATKMTADEIEYIASVFVNEGVNKIRLTGGEPLIRKDTKEIIKRLAKFPVELAITTNGVFVDEFIDVFKESGLHSVNVSLDSLDKEKYFEITKRDEYVKVKKNIDLLISNNFTVKVNAVMMKGVNDDEIINFVEWTKEVPVHVRFIEFMPFTGNQWSNRRVIPQKEIMNLISSKFNYTKLTDEKNDTAKKYIADGHKGTFAVISTMSSPFCNGCNRMRLTTDGKMKNCLFSKKEVDILSALRSGEDILPLIKLCVSNKEQALGGQFTAAYKNTDASKINNRSMINIGG